MSESPTNNERVLKVNQTDSRAIDRRASRRFGSSRRENLKQYLKEVQQRWERGVFGEELKVDFDLKEPTPVAASLETNPSSPTLLFASSPTNPATHNKSSVCSIWPPQRRRHPSATSELGLVASSPGLATPPSSVSACASAQASCDMSFAIPLNQVDERTDIMAGESNRRAMNNRSSLLASAAAGRVIQGRRQAGGSDFPPSNSLSTAATIRLVASTLSSSPSLTPRTSSLGVNNPLVLMSRLRGGNVLSSNNLSNTVSEREKAALLKKLEESAKAGSSVLVLKSPQQRYLERDSVVMTPSTVRRDSGGSSAGGNKGSRSRQPGQRVYSSRGVIVEKLMPIGASKGKSMRHYSGTDPEEKQVLESSVKQKSHSQSIAGGNPRDVENATEDAVGTLENEALGTSGPTTAAPATVLGSTAGSAAARMMDSTQMMAAAAPTGIAGSGPKTVDTIKALSGSATKQKQQQQQQQDKSLLHSSRSASGDSGDDDEYEPEGEEGEEETGVLVRFEDMLYLWDLNRDMKDLVHSRIRDLGFRRFLGMGIFDKGSVAPEILIPEPGPIYEVQAELEARVNRPSFMEKRWL